MHHTKSLEDYIIDTGDALYIEFENFPRGLNSLNEEKQNKMDPTKVSYLEPKNDLTNYILDEVDIINIKFKNIAKGDPKLLKKSTKNKPIVTDYLTPISNLKNYKLDQGDTIDIQFLYVPEFNSIKKIDLSELLKMKSLFTS